MAIEAALRRLVRQRASNRCEYCGLHQDDLPFVMLHVDHVISRQHLGGDEEGNLCLACHSCNFNKGTNIATREAGDLVPLFNPRTQN
jgi:5-methylcytosine-specific restriction endonuclease McrA